MDAGLVPAVRLGLAELRRLIPRAGERLAAVSAWSVGEHIGHCALVDCAVLRRVLGPTPADPGLQPAGSAAAAVLASGRLPRGLAQAPAAVLPTAADPACLDAGLEAAERLLQALEPELPRLLADPSLIRHALFGGLDRRQWLRLVSIHQRHHLAIIADILGPAAGEPGAVEAGPDTAGPGQG